MYVCVCIEIGHVLYLHTYYLGRYVGAYMDNVIPGSSLSFLHVDCQFYIQEDLIFACCLDLSRPTEH